MSSPLHVGRSGWVDKTATTRRSEGPYEVTPDQPCPDGNRPTDLTQDNPKASIAARVRPAARTGPHQPAGPFTVWLSQPNSPATVETARPARPGRSSTGRPGPCTLPSAPRSPAAARSTCPPRSTAQDHAADTCATPAPSDDRTPAGPPARPAADSSTTPEFHTPDSRPARRQSRHALAAANPPRSRHRSRSSRVGPRAARTFASRWSPQGLQDSNGVGTTGSASPCTAPDGPPRPAAYTPVRSEAPVNRARSMLRHKRTAAPWTPPTAEISASAEPRALRGHRRSPQPAHL